MTASNGYAVFFFPPALEALGDAIKPYLQDTPAGPHVLCSEIDTGGALLEMTIQGVTQDGGSVLLDLMVPTSMVRMIVSSQSDASFGFGPRVKGAVVSVPLVGVGGSVETSNDGGSAPAKGKVKGKKTEAKPVKRKSPAQRKAKKGNAPKSNAPKSKSPKGKSTNGKSPKGKSTKAKTAKGSEDEVKRKAVRKG